MDKTFPFGEIFKATVKTLFVNFKDWVRLFAGPAALVAVTGIVLAMAFLGSQESMGLFLVVILASLASFAASIIFTVRIYRYVLLGEMPEKTWSLEWSRRHWMTILYIIAVILIMLGIGLALFIPAGLMMALGAEVNQTLTIIYGVIAVFCLFVFGARYAAVTGLVAIDAATPIKESWHMIGVKTALKFLVLTLALIIPLSVISLLIILPLAGIDVGIATLTGGMHSQAFFSSIGNMLGTGLYTFAMAHVLKSLRAD